MINPKVKDLIEWIICIIAALVLALVIRYFIGTPTVVESSSMYPTLIEGQRLVLDRKVRTFGHTFERGEIVTFEAPTKTKEYNKANDEPIATFFEPKGAINEFIYYVLEIGKTSFIKRVIALPGEHVTIKGGKVYINDELLDEPYLQDGVATEKTGEYYDLIVPEGTLFLMGDNREKSMDCRSFGCVPISKIESKVWIRFWPFNLFGEVN